MASKPDTPPPEKEVVLSYPTLEEILDSCSYRLCSLGPWESMLQEKMQIEQCMRPLKTFTEEEKKQLILQWEEQKIELLREKSRKEEKKRKKQLRQAEIEKRSHRKHGRKIERYYTTSLPRYFECEKQEKREVKKRCNQKQRAKERRDWLDERKRQVKRQKGEKQWDEKIKQEEEKKQANLKLIKAMKEGKVALRLIKCLCQGPPRVGKTHIKHLLLGKVLVDSSSTGLAEHPERAFRNISAEKYEVSKETWEVMDNQRLMLLMANEMSQLKLDEDEDEDENDDAETNELDTPDPHTQESSVENVIRQLKSLMQDNILAHPTTSNQEWIYFIDSGGQPQFQEVLQAFIPKTSVILLVFKLIEKLSDTPLMVYQKSGVNYNLGQYALSNQEILIRLAQMIHSSSNSSMQVALLGTYHDEYVKSDPPSETIEEKELHLQEIFSFCKKNTIFRDSKCRNVIFPLNGLQAVKGKFDDPIVCKLRSSITSTPYAVQVDVPIRWHALELAIQAEASRSNTQVLSLQKCIELAADLNFPPEDVETALSFLSDYNLIVYYPSLLPDVVFTTPQVLLDKVTELTERVYQLSDNEDSPNYLCPTRGEYKIMRDLGIISTQILKDFPKYYIPHLFTEEDLVKIFEYLYIFARLEDGSFFMPALLPPFTPDELDKLLNPSTPLLFHFEDSCAPAVIVCLTSHHVGWKVRHDIKPLMGTKSNAVCFQIPGLRLVITLADSFNQFEVHYQCPPKYEKYLPKLREVVSDSLEEVIYNRNFNINMPKQSFFCRAPECKDTPRHIAIPAILEKELICSKDPLRGCEMNDIESKWLEPISLSFVDPDSPILKDLMDSLVEMSPKWNIFGMQLGVPTWKRENLETENATNETRLMKVFEYWGRNPTHSNPFTWQTIVNVLASDAIKDYKLAGEIQKKYLKKEQC